MDRIDRQLLDLMQGQFPLVQRPFIELGRPLGLSEDEAIARVKGLKDQDIIRQIGPIYSSKHIGYHSTLAAFSVKPERLELVADQVSLHHGVSHNYSRDHEYNLWFTLTLPKEKDLHREIKRMAVTMDVGDYLFLPSLRTFRLGVHFDLSEKGVDQRKSEIKTESDHGEISDFSKDVIRETQGHLPLISKPFAPAAEALGISEEKLLKTLQGFMEQGILRRFAAVLRHRKAGFTANGMGCWVISAEEINSAGRLAAGFRSVSHCYHRPAYPPKWPYNLFTMVHGHSEDEVAREIEKIRKAIQPKRYRILYSVKEFKKERVRYFEETK